MNEGKDNFKPAPSSTDEQTMIKTLNDVISSNPESDIRVDLIRKMRHADTKVKDYLTQLLNFPDSLVSSELHQIEFLEELKRRLKNEKSPTARINIASHIARNVATLRAMKTAGEIHTTLLNYNLSLEDLLRYEKQNLIQEETIVNN